MWILACILQVQWYAQGLSHGGYNSLGVAVVCLYKEFIYRPIFPVEYCLLSFTFRPSGVFNGTW